MPKFLEMPKSISRRLSKRPGAIEAESSTPGSPSSSTAESSTQAAFATLFSQNVSRPVSIAALQNDKIEMLGPETSPNIASPNRGESKEDLFHDEESPHLTLSKKRYYEAVRECEKAYNQYVAQNENIHGLDSAGIFVAAQKALSCPDTSQAGNVFGDVVEAMLKKLEVDKTKPSISREVGKQMSKLFPLMKFALGVASQAADVPELC